MRWDGSRRLAVLIGLFTLLALGGALAEESFIHTDDGCPVETHCLACRLAVGNAAVMAPAIVSLVPGLHVVGQVVADANPRPRQTDTPHSPSRGPPQA